MKIGTGLKKCLFSFSYVVMENKYYIICFPTELTSAGMVINVTRVTEMLIGVSIIHKLKSNAYNESILIHPLC